MKVIEEINPPVDRARKVHLDYVFSPSIPQSLSFDHFESNYSQITFKSQKEVAHLNLADNM